MRKAFGALVATGAVATVVLLGGCADRKTVVHRETETIRQEPRVVEERTVVKPPAEQETTVIERRRRTVEEDDQ
jgi:hypothetical protein